MPSFNVVSEVDMHEVTNAVDQVRREISQRYDFKGSKAKVELNDLLIVITSEDDMKSKALQQMLKEKFAKRKVDLNSLDFGEEKHVGGDMIRQEVKVKEGLEQDELKRLVKIIKDSKLKVQAKIEGNQLRVNGKKRDDLQDVISLLKESVKDLSLQYDNFRD